MKKLENELKLFIRLSGAIFFMISPFFLFTIQKNMSILFTIVCLINFCFVAYYLQKVLLIYLGSYIGRFEISVWTSIGFVIIFTTLSYIVTRTTTPHECTWEDCPHIGRTEFISSWHGGHKTGSKAYLCEKIHFKNPTLSYEECEAKVNEKIRN